MQGLSVHFFTDLLVTKEGYCYLLVAVDYFSHWVKAQLLKTKLSAKVGGWFYKHFLTKLK